MVLTGINNADALQAARRHLPMHEKPMDKGDSYLRSVPEDLFITSCDTLRAAARAQARPSAEPENTSFHSGFVSGYMDARQVDARVMELAAKYPDLVKVVTRDYRTEGYDGREKDLQGPAPLRYVVVQGGGKESGERMGVLLTASPHAREKVNPLVILEVLEELCANYHPGSSDPRVRELSDLMNSLTIYLVPDSNPDGLNFAVHDDPDWRKTRAAIEGSEEKGVDINRNYPYLWEAGKPESPTYPGPSPLSEPETRHVAGIVDEHPEIKVACDFHSCGEEVRIPMGITDRGDQNKYETIQQRLIKAIRQVRGKDYNPVFSDVIKGAGDDFLYHRKGIYALVVEDASVFSPPADEALKVVKDMTAGAIEVLRAARDLGRGKLLAA